MRKKKRWGLIPISILLLLFMYGTFQFSLGASEEKTKNVNVNGSVSQAASAYNTTNTIDHFKKNSTTNQDVSGYLNDDEGGAKGRSNFPENPESYVPLPIPQPMEPRVPKVENKWVSYNLITGKEKIHNPPPIKGDRPIKDMVIGGIGYGEIDDKNKSGGSPTEEGTALRNFTDLSLISNPEDHPWCVNVKLYMTFASGNYVASGVLIDSLHVLTAGHCVHDVANGGTWATSIVVVPAYENGWRPYGDAVAVQLHSWSGWTVNADFDHDMGVIDLDRPIGALTGWHGYGYNDDPNFYTGNTFNNPGYPAESPYNGQYMYYWYGTFDFTESSGGVWYGNEVGFYKRAYGGQSGSGAYYISSGSRYVYAVISNTVKVSGGPSKYPRITSGKFYNIRDDIIAVDTPSSFDLIPMDVETAPSSLSAGDQLTSMSYAVHNYSSASWSGNVYVDVYLSTNDNISTSDTLLQGHYFNWNFSPKSSVRINVSTPPTIPSGTSPGNYYIGVIITNSDYNTANNDTDGQDASPVAVSCPTPGAFSYISPSCGATGISTSADLDWSTSSGATSYDVYFGTSTNPPYATTVTGSYYDPGTLATGTTYYWKIVAQNSCGSYSGSVCYFTTTCSLPPTPGSPSPADGATGVSTAADLDWGDCSGAASYDVYFGTSSSPPYVATVTGSNYDLGPLIPGTGYYWKIVAKNSCGSTSGPVWDFTTASMSPRTWTFMVYLDGDNNLEFSGIEDFLEMATVGSDVNVNIVVQFDRISGYDTSYDNWTDTKRYYITSGLTPTNDNALMTLGEVNMGHPSTLIDFVNWTKSHYPASRYALILWDHGSGWRIPEENATIFKSICSDNTSGDVLYMDEVQGALSSSGGAQLIGFDACLMGMVEVGYEIRNHGEVMVGSEETEPGDGWPYDTILTDLTTHPTLSASQLGSYIVLRYYESYGNSYTQSAIDLGQMNTLAGTISSFAQTMIDNWDTNPSAVTSAADNVMNAISSAVIREEHGASWPGANGLAIYFPETSGQFDPDYNGTIIDFPSDTQWEEFLQEFYSSMGGSWIADARDASQEFYVAEHVDLFNFCENIHSYCPPPGAFSYISPSNGVTGLPLDTNLDWSDSSGATSYDVYFGTSSTPPKVGTVTGSYYDPGTLNYGTLYHWKIVAKNSCGETPGPVWSFTTMDCILPGTPTNPYPPDGSALCTGPNYNLTWSSCSNATSYDVYFGTTSTPPKVGTVTNTTYNVGILAPGNYWWRIAAKNSCGETVGPYWSFTIISPPAAFSYISPSNGAAGLPLDTDLDWNDSSGATSYDVYFGTSSSPPFHGNTTTSFYDLPQLQCGTQYYWKIIAKNVCGSTPGDVWNFTTENCASPYISSLTPTEGLVGTPVIISGSDFGPTQETVTFNGVNAAITSWSDTQINTEVPTGATTGPVVVHTSAGDSNGVTFTVTEQPPAKKADFDRDGYADVIWRYQGPEGYNAVWLSGNVSGTASAKGISSTTEVIKEMNMSVKQPGKSLKMTNWATLPESQRHTVIDGFAEKGNRSENFSSPAALESMSHVMATSVSDPRNDPQSVNLDTVADQNWKLAGTGDFNGDGYIDIVWSNVDTAHNCVWYMNGTTFAGYAQLPDGSTTDWVLGGVGDFDRDGNPDLIWHNVVDGRNGVWYMDGVQLKGIDIMTTGANVDWQLCGTDDFNNDGHVDLVWRNISDGCNAVWYMDGVELSSVGWLDTVADQNWKLRGTGDFNNDGKIDLIWTFISDGRNCIWYLDNITLTSVEFLTTVTDTTWMIRNQ